MSCLSFFNCIQTTTDLVKEFEIKIKKLGDVLERVETLQSSIINLHIAKLQDFQPPTPNPTPSPDSLQKAVSS